MGKRVILLSKLKTLAFTFAVITGILVTNRFCLAATKTLALGDDLQSAVSAAKGGDTLVLPDGYRWTGNLILPWRAPDDTQWITIRSNLNLPVGWRVQPDQPKAILYTNNSEPVIANDIENPDRTKRVTHHWKFEGLTMTSTPNNPLIWALIHIWVQAPGNADRNYARVSDLSHDFEFDHCYVHGLDTGDMGRGLYVDANYVSVNDNWIDNWHSTFIEANAVASPSTQGHYSLINNFLEGAGESVFFGAGPQIVDLQASSYTIQHNYITKRMSWKGGPWTVKNLLEFKSGSDIQIDHNLFENIWEAQQSGGAILFTPRTRIDTGFDKTIHVRNAVFSDNIVRHVAKGVSLLDFDDGATRLGNIPIAQLTRSGNFTFRNNLFDDISGAKYASGGAGAGIGIKLSGLPDLVTIDHNTFNMAETFGQNGITNPQLNECLQWGSQFQYQTQGDTYPNALGFAMTNNDCGWQLYGDGVIGPDAVPHSWGGDFYAPGSSGVFTANTVRNVEPGRVQAWRNSRYPDTLINVSAPAGVGADIGPLLAGEDYIRTGIPSATQPGTPAITTPSPLPGGITGTAYSQNLSASGGTVPYTWSILTGSLPAGLSLDPASGQISGTPTTAETATFTAQVADNASQTISKAFAVNIIPPSVVTPPAISPNGGTNLKPPQSVTIACPAADAQARYTTDGSEPSNSSTVYSGALNFSDYTILKAACFRTDGSFSTSTSAAFAFTAPVGTVATPYFSPQGGNFTLPLSVTLQSATPGAYIYYTLDGTDPSISSYLYQSSFTVTTTTTVKAVALKTGLTDSAIARVIFTKVARAALPAPDLSHLPRYVAVDANLAFDYSAENGATEFKWSMTPGGPSTKGYPSPGLFAADGIAKSFSSQSPQFSLLGKNLPVGTYTLRVTALDASGASSPPGTATITLVSADFSQARVYPNPWRKDKHATINVTFDRLPLGSTVKLFTVSGHRVNTLTPVIDTATWDLTNDQGDKVASGIYVYLITAGDSNNGGNSQRLRGKLAVIK